MQNFFKFSTLLFKKLRISTNKIIHTITHIRRNCALNEKKTHNYPHFSHAS